MEPTKGRIVNYHCIEGEKYLCNDEDKVLPAIITRVHGGAMKAVDVVVFTHNPSMPITMRTSISYGMTNGGGWSWPVMQKVADPSKIETPAVNKAAQRTQING